MRVCINLIILKRLKQILKVHAIANLTMIMKPNLIIRIILRKFGKTVCYIWSNLDEEEAKYSDF